MKDSVIVVTHAGTERLRDVLASLAPYSDRSDVEIILVDNGAPDEVATTAARDYPWARAIRSDRNLGFSGGVNLGVEASRGEILVLLNDDAAAEDGFVEAHLDALDTHPEAAASGGRLVSWDGSRHDFLTGRVTFDIHAFQVGQGWPANELTTPDRGQQLPFACGGNMAIRRRDWQRVGGFDPELFAYFEDVEMGWRLWAMGREVVAAPSAVARHRGSATSAGFGDFRRGVLFERNALRIFQSCADAEHRSALGPAVYTTFLHRLVAFAKSRPELTPHVNDPFGSMPGPLGFKERWGNRLRAQGPAGAVRHAVARLLLGPKAGSPRIDESHFLMQLRAANGFFEGLDETDKRRREMDRQRTVPDREILARFPRMVVPTYMGDEEWFGSDAFRGMLPDDWSVEFADLDDIVHPSLRE